MREYTQVAPTFWTGSTGRQLRQKGSDHLLVAMYLISSPSSPMTGVYHLPFGYIASDVGISIEKVKLIMDELIEMGFCAYDHEAQWVFVSEMARFQVGSTLSLNDKRVSWIISQVAKCPSDFLKHSFYERYQDAYHLSEAPPPAPSKAQLVRAKIPASVRWKVLERDKHTCQYCGKPSPLVRLEVDHIVAVVNGGTSAESNLITACWECNAGKSSLNMKPLPQPLLPNSNSPSPSQDHDQDHDQEQEKDHEQEKDIKTPRSRIKRSGGVAVKEPAKSTETWEAYKEAYTLRYRVAPLTNAKNNKLLCTIVDLVGKQSAPLLVAYYLTSNARIYVDNRHPLTLLVRDCQSIHTQMLSGVRATSLESKSLEQRDNAQGQLARLRAEMALEGGAHGSA